MDERDQLHSQWSALTIASRESLFRTWILTETGSDGPAEIVVSHLADGRPVDYNFASDLSSWHVAVADSLFSSSTADQAIAVGEALIEVSHLFAEARQERDEMSEAELEDETPEAQEFLFEEAVRGAIEGLEALIAEYENQIGEADEQDAAAVADLQDAIANIQKLIDWLHNKINEPAEASD